MQAYIVLIALVVVLGFTTIQGITQSAALRGELRDSKEGQRRAVEARKFAEAISVRAAQKNAATARKQASAGRSLEAALAVSGPACAASGPWASQTVPKEVQDALR